MAVDYPNPITIAGAGDGTRVTVNDMLRSPNTIPMRVLSIANAQFIADQILRSGPAATAGVVKYYASTPLYSKTDTRIVGEFGEIPLGTNEFGTPMFAATVKRALGVRVSIEEANRNDVDSVNKKITQTTNTFVRDFDAQFMSNLDDAVTFTGNTVAASAAWDTSSGNPRTDILDANQLVVQATVPNEPKNFFGFTPDTILISRFDVDALLENANIWQPFTGGNIANLNPQVTGQIPATLFGKACWASWNITSGTAYVLERKTVGFISDERPLHASPMMWHADNEFWRTNVVRQSVSGVDEPYAVARITGIVS